MKPDLIACDGGLYLAAVAEHNTTMNADADKIHDPELGRFAATQDWDEPRSVIVELKMEPPELAPCKTLPRPRVPGQSSPLFDLTRIGEDNGMMDQLEKELIALGLGRDLVRLNAAQAFVVTVSPSQLRAVSRLPLVGIIRPNRTHRVPPSRNQHPPDRSLS